MMQEIRLELQRCEGKLYNQINKKAPIGYVVDDRLSEMIFRQLYRPLRRRHEMNKEKKRR